MSTGIGAEDLYGDLEDEGSELGVESGGISSVQTARVKELEDEVGLLSRRNLRRRNENAKRITKTKNRTRTFVVKCPHWRETYQSCSRRQKLRWVGRTRELKNWKVRLNGYLLNHNLLCTLLHTHKSFDTNTTT